MNIAWDSLNVVSDSDDENISSLNLLLTNTQLSKLHKAFSNNSSANIKLSKTHWHKIEQSGGFSGILLGPLLKTGLPLIGNVLKPLAKSVLITLVLTAAASAIDAAIHKKCLDPGVSFSDLAWHPTFIISNAEINDVMKIIQPPEESGLLIEGVSKTIKNEAKEQKGVCY